MRTRPEHLHRHSIVANFRTVFLDRPFPPIVANPQLPIRCYQYRYTRCPTAVHSSLRTLNRHRTFGWKDVVRRWYRHQTANKCPSPDHCFRFVALPLLSVSKISPSHFAHLFICIIIIIPRYWQKMYSMFALILSEL